MITIPAIDMVATGRNITRMRQNAGLTVKYLRIFFGFATPQAIYKWQHGTAMPTIDKIKCVKYAKMRKGEYMGRTPFYGYKKSEARKNMLEPDEPVAEVVCRIFYMDADGMKFSLIARKLNEEGVPGPLMYRKENNTYEGHNWKAASDITYWTPKAIRRIVNEERYTGTMIGLKYTVTGVSSKKVKPVPKEDWIVVENANEPMVSKELFAQVQDILRHIRKPVQKIDSYKNEEYRGYVKCVYCGRVLPNSHGRDTYYFLTSRVFDTQSTKAAPSDCILK